MPLHFMRYRGHSRGTKSVKFVLYDGDREVQCEVSDKAMDEAEDARDVHPSQREEQFRRLRTLLINCATRKFFSGQFERGNDPRIFINPSDLMLR
jgi:hypothetical protein